MLSIHYKQDGTLEEGSAFQERTATCVCKMDKKYNGPFKINEAELKELLDLCAKQIIPSQYHNYYQSLVAGSDEKHADD